jgi:hypothetical protein
MLRGGEPFARAPCRHSPVVSVDRGHVAAGSLTPFGPDRRCRHGPIDWIVARVHHQPGEIDMRVQGLALIALMAASASAFAQNTRTTNSAGFYYYPDDSNPDHAGAFTNIDSYSQPTALIIAGECNRDDPRFAEARAKGAEVLAYINVVERQQTPPCAPARDLYTVGSGYAPFWPAVSGEQRVNYKGKTYTTYMLDIHAGTSWPDKVVAYVEALMKEDKVDGVFLDVLGGRLWGPDVDWTNSCPYGQEASCLPAGRTNPLARSPDWTQAERDDWTNGAVDIVRRIDAKRRALNPQFIVVNNNNWDNNFTGLTPKSTLGVVGEQYVDGIAIEHKLSTEEPQRRFANRDYSNLHHRRVIVIARPTDTSTAAKKEETRMAEERAWRNVDGVTHTTSQLSYGFAPAPTTPTPPTKTFTRLTDRLRAFGRTSETSSSPSEGMAADKKRASRFQVTQSNVVLQSLWAYLDGDPAVQTGTQPVRLALYSDVGGVPDQLKAESATKWFGPGQPAGWRSFTLLPQYANVTLAPGNYWIAIHTGTDEGIARNYNFGTSGSWISNYDAFNDGALSQWGTQSITGATNLVVYATYRVVQP